MALTKKQKEEILKGLTDSFGNFKSVVFAANEGLSVSDISKFRTQLREKNANFQIAKKTLIKIAAKKNNLPELSDELLVGPVGVVFSPEDELFPAKVTQKYSKGNNKLVIRGGIFFGEVVNAAKVMELASIPSREELLAKLLGCINAPLSNFVGIGNSLISSFVRACSEVAKKKA